MAEDKTVAPITDDGFEPEPIPDNIADTDINGLNEVQTDEDAPEEAVDDETSDDQPEEPVETTDEKQAEEEDEKPEAASEEEEQQELTPAQRSYQERQQARVQRDYVQEERQKIREYEQNTDTSDIEERLKIMEARDYVNTVERNRQSVSRDVAAAQEIPFFKSGSDQAQLLFQQSLENFANAYGVVDPESGEWIAAQDRNGNDVQLYPYLQQQAATFEQALKDAKQSARSEVQQSEAKMRAKAVNPSNAGKARSSGDELDDLLDRIGDTPLW